MRKIHKIYYIANSLMFFFVFLTIYSCQSRKIEIPPSFKPFPTDTTVLSIAPIPSIVKECSGMIKWKNALWTHNDSGGATALYTLNATDGTLKKTYKIKNVTHKDWEAITQDAAYLLSLIHI